MYLTHWAAINDIIYKSLSEDIIPRELYMYISVSSKTISNSAPLFLVVVSTFFQSRKYALSIGKFCKTGIKVCIPEY